MSPSSPSREQLLELACKFARELHGIEPPEAELGERIDYVLWGRKQAWACVEAGIITREEMISLLIDHLDYECAHVSGRAWAELDEGVRGRFVDAVTRVLFGAPADS